MSKSCSVELPNVQVCDARNDDSSTKVRLRSLPANNITIKKKSLRQRRKDSWSERPGSNRPPRPWQGRALPNELLSHISCQILNQASKELKLLPADVLTKAGSPVRTASSGRAKIRHEPFLKKFTTTYLYLGVYKVLSCTGTSCFS